MVTNISSKSELNSLASRLSSQAIQLKSVSDELKSFLNSIPNLVICMGKDNEEIRNLLYTGFYKQSNPFCIRYELNCHFFSYSPLESSIKQKSFSG